MRFKHILGLLSAAAMSIALAGVASAQDKTVKIGAIYPLSGNAASAGVHGKAAIETAVDIINNAHPELGNLPLAKNAGLAGLGGAKVEMVFADNQGSPATGQNQALRLITEEKVVALSGAYQSGITLTTSAIAEKYGIPFVNGESVAANLTERGFKWFFRTTPVAADFAKIYLDFLRDMKAGGAKTDSVAIVHENTEYGTSVASVISFRVQGERPQHRPRYSLRCQRDRCAEPGVAAQGQEAGRGDHDQLYVGRDPVRQDNAGARLQAADAASPTMPGFPIPRSSRRSARYRRALFNRSSWSVGPPGSPTVLITEMYKKRSGDEMDDTVGAPDAGLLRAVAMRSIAPARPIPPRSRRR